MMAFAIIFTFSFKYFVRLQKLCIFAAERVIILRLNMKSKETKTVAQLKEKIFREKAQSFYMCFIDDCPLHGQCLKWLIGQYADTNYQYLLSVNPRNPQVGGENCVLFQPDKRVKMKRGMTRFYHDMPGHLERSIRSALISAFGRRHYFEMRRGDRLITPDQLNTIINTCHRFGWTAPLIFDGEDEDWIW